MAYYPSSSITYKVERTNDDGKAVNYIMDAGNPEKVRIFNSFAVANTEAKNWVESNGYHPLSVRVAKNSMVNSTLDYTEA